MLDERELRARWVECAGENHAFPQEAKLSRKMGFMKKARFMRVATSARNADIFGHGLSKPNALGSGAMQRQDRIRALIDEMWREPMIWHSKYKEDSEQRWISRNEFFSMARRRGFKDGTFMTDSEGQIPDFITEEGWVHGIRSPKFQRLKNEWLEWQAQEAAVSVGTSLSNATMSDVTVTVQIAAPSQPSAGEAEAIPGPPPQPEPDPAPEPVPVMEAAPVPVPDPEPEPEPIPTAEAVFVPIVEGTAVDNSTSEFVAGDAGANETASVSAESAPSASRSGMQNAPSPVPESGDKTASPSSAWAGPVKRNVGMDVLRAFEEAKAAMNSVPLDADFSHEFREVDKYIITIKERRSGVSRGGRDLYVYYPAQGAKSCLRMRVLRSVPDIRRHFRMF